MTLTKFNKIFSVVLSIITLFISVYVKDLKVLVFILYIIVPFIIKLNSCLTIIYLLFGFISILNGGLLHLYKTTIWYDSFAHFTWGVISCLLGLGVLKYFKMYNEKNIIFNIIFIIIFSLGASCIWEVIEFGSDTLFKLDMQRRATGVYDTMKDIIVTIFGNILFIVWYLFELKNKKLLIRNFIDML